MAKRCKDKIPSIIHLNGGDKVLFCPVQITVKIEQASE
jgi:hypothetical protein